MIRDDRVAIQIYENEFALASVVIDCSVVRNTPSSSVLDGLEIESTEEAHRRWTEEYSPMAQWWHHSTNGGEKQNNRPGLDGGATTMETTTQVRARSIVRSRSPSLVITQAISPRSTVER